MKIRARPDAVASESEDLAGAYANCYIDFPDSRGAEVLARWYVAFAAWIPECVLEMHEIDQDAPLGDAADYVREASEEGFCIVIHGWAEDAEDAEDDDVVDWNPPDAADRRLASIAGTYIDAAPDGDVVLVLGTDRHFGWGRETTRDSGTWHVADGILTLAYFPTEGATKAILDGPWLVKPGFLVGTGTTLRRTEDD